MSCIIIAISTHGSRIYFSQPRPPKQFIQLSICAAAGLDKQQQRNPTLKQWYRRNAVGRQPRCALRR